jgi:hypothetical protein
MFTLDQSTYLRVTDVLYVFGFRKNLFFVVVIVDKCHFSSQRVLDIGQEGTKYIVAKRVKDGSNDLWIKAHYSPQKL